MGKKIMKRTKMMLVVLTAFLLMAFAAAQADVIVLQTSPQGGDTVDWSSTGFGVGTQAHGFLGYSAGGTQLRRPLLVSLPIRAD